MKRILILLLIVFSIGCTTETPQEYSLLAYTPKDAAVIIQIQNFESFRSELKNNQLLKSFRKPAFKQDFNAFVDYLQYIKPNAKSLLCFTESGKNSFEYTFITKIHLDLIVLDSLTKTTTEKIPYEGKTITKTIVNDRANYTFIADSIFINSSSELLIENCIRSYNTATVDETLKKVYTTIDETKSATVLANPKYVQALLKKLFPNADTNMVTNFGAQAALDISMLPDEISFTGIVTANDSLGHTLSSLKNTLPRTSTIAKVIPPFFEYFTSITFDAYEKFQPKTKNSQLDALEEVATFRFNGTTFMGLRFISSSNEAMTQLQTNSEYSTVRNTKIYKNEDKTLFKDHFSPFINTFDNRYFVILDEFIVFSESDGLRNLAMLIGMYKDKQTLFYKENYTETIKNLSDASSILTFVNTDRFKKTFAESTQKKYQKEVESINLKKYPFAVLQFTYETGNTYAHVHGMLKRNTVKASKNTISQLLNIVLDHPVATNPQFVKNHITKRKEIVVQDDQNMLYLISTAGKVLWKKQLDGKILGKISQVDLYKNGRLQLACTTPQSFYVLDRNGKDVKPYPTKAKTTYTQPVAIFDYDRSKNYRFVFTEGNKVKMHDKKGKTVSGFKFYGSENDFINPPQHFRVRTKDYITFQESNGKLHILSRTGKPRITPKKNIQFSENTLYIHNNLFTTSDRKGNLIQIDQKGQFQTTKLPVENNHDVVMTSKTLVSFSENKLRIKGKTVELDFGSYSKPNIFYIRNKIYVTITDKDAQKVYLFDSNAKPIAGFPAFGSSAIDLANFDKDNKLELVTKGEDNTILVYKLN
ncbi:MAG: ribonuclease HII [Bacteroidota bacterium]